MRNETNPADGLSYNKEEQAQATDDDSALVGKCRNGDLDAFEQLVTKHQKKMFNISYRMLGDYAEACEVVQDSFFAAWKNIRDFRGEAKFSTWLTTVTLNQAKNRLKQMRSRNNRIILSLDEPVETADGSMMIDSPSPGPSQLERLEAGDVRSKVRECIDALEPEYREVIILRDLQDLSYEEIGWALKVRSGTVKSRLFRARDSVKECLKKALGDAL